MPDLDYRDWESVGLVTVTLSWTALASLSQDKYKLDLLEFIIGSSFKKLYKIFVSICNIVYEKTYLAKKYWI